MTSRRNVLMLVGGGVVLAAGAAGAGAYAWASGQTPSAAAREVKTPSAPTGGAP